MLAIRDGISGRITVIFLLAVFWLFGGASDLDVARDALRDGLWEVARNHAMKEDSDEAKLIILESYASEGKWDEVRRELKDVESTGCEFDYYRSVVAGDIAGAIVALERGGSISGIAESKMLKANLLLKNDNRVAAEREWSDVLAMTNVSERAFAVAAINLGEIKTLRKAYEIVESTELRYLVGLRLGRELIKSSATADEGEDLICSIVKENPGAEGAVDAFLELARVKLNAKEWQTAERLYAQAWEMWPQVAKMAIALEGRGEAAMALGNIEMAIDFLFSAEKLSNDDALTALAILKEGDALSAIGKGEESLAKYRQVLKDYPNTEVARQLKSVIKVRELEAKGRELYRAYDFEGALQIFKSIANDNPSLGFRMIYFEVLCLYGMGMDNEALKKAESLAEVCTNLAIKREVILWIAKFAYNQGDWKKARQRFLQFAEENPNDSLSPMAMLWAARAAFADADFGDAIKVGTDIIARYPKSEVVNAAILVQGETLIELARFDEAVLVLDRVGKSDSATTKERFKANVFKADALFAMGADNSVRYEAALEEYRKIGFDGLADGDLMISVAFKIGRTLEKLKRYDEAIDQYYSQVILAYRNGVERGEKFNDETKAIFSRAAFRLVDEFERRGRNRQALNILQLILTSDVPASEEAARRYERLSLKGKFL